MRELTLQVESSVHAPALSRSAIAPIKASLEPRYEDVLLLISELVSNCVRHSGTDGIDVRVETANGRIRVEVSDDGPGFSTKSPRGDGLGLTIVDKLADEWGLVPGDRFTVWAELSYDAV
ncbi:MAG: ATP-binding protein [Acidimicrobiia bacterium]|jgi:nitrate/nitrite-specific signal transduction histidine kinase